MTDRRLGPLAMLVWGGLGATLTEGVRLKNIVTIATPSMPDLTVEYGLMMAAFIVTGALFTVYYRPASVLKAIYIGAGWPAILSAAGQALPRG